MPSEYDFIFMDVQMPVIDGYEATMTIRSSKHVDAKSVPIIAMTANAFPEDVQKCLSAGMNGHIGKPISVEAIAQELSKL
ncbi:response regulator [Eubacterium aggregans]|uniref:response regulator n=1 Tax=Eubacterium aggregans TaxID=81409 RepID=UPI003F3FAF1F